MMIYKNGKKVFGKWFDDYLIAFEDVIDTS